MDKEELKIILRKFVASIEAEGYPIAFAGLPPVFPEFEKPYKLILYSPTLSKLDAPYELLAKRKHELLSLTIRHEVGPIELCRTPQDIACREEDVIVNKINYRPLTLPYRLLEMA